MSNDATTDSPRSAPAITVSWLVRLRWWALVGQVSTVAVTLLGLRVPLQLFPLGLIAGATAASNVWLGSRRGEAIPAWRVPMVLVFDTLSLTGLLYFTGGPANPFSVLYLVHVTLAAVVAGLRWTSALVALSAASYALLFFTHVPVPMLSHVHHQPGGRPSPHLWGMWVAFAITAALIAYFVTHLAAELREREARLADAERLAARSERLASLTTLAAGAAHELGTPLGTIAIAAKELERALTLSSADGALVEDARLIRAEAARCRDVLQQMSGRSGQPAGELPERTSPAAIVAALHARIGPLERARLVVTPSPELASTRLLVPTGGLSQVLTSLLRNGLDAGAERVVLTVETDPHKVRFVLQDDGAGMAPEVVARLGERFFTTKAPGSGMGLGVFLARSFAESWGGSLGFSSSTTSTAHGTRATLELPLRAGDAHERRGPAGAPDTPHAPPADPSHA